MTKLILSSVPMYLQSSRTIHKPHNLRTARPRHNKSKTSLFFLFGFVKTLISVSISNVWTNSAINRRHPFKPHTVGISANTADSIGCIESSVWASYRPDHIRRNYGFSGCYGSRRLGTKTLWEVKPYVSTFLFF